MFSFFKKNPVKVNTTHEGNHGKHWYSVFEREDSPELFIKHIEASLNGGSKKPIDKNTTLLDGPLVRSIIYKDTMPTGFPCWRGTKYERYTTAVITEWAHVRSLEAVITAAAPSGRAISFFATDYSFNKERYKNEKDIEVNIVGCVYYIEPCTPETMAPPGMPPLSEDFCGYFPSKDADEIVFIGKIEHVQPHLLADVEGFLITVHVTTENVLDMFVSRGKVTTSLEVGARVMGAAWLIGSIENK